MTTPPAGKIGGAHIPTRLEATPDLELAAKYTPIIYFDEKEPFFPLVAGVTVFQKEGRSPSFPRIIEKAYLPEWSVAIEYAIWWDWDIGHLYELEHVWSFVNAAGELVWVEGSFHGQYFAMLDGNGNFPHEGTHPVVYSQPGKHAFSGETVMFRRILYIAMRETDLFAGQSGVLIKDMFQGVITPQPGDNDLVGAYLKTKAFTPSLKFTRRFEIEPQMLVSWKTLNAWIPARVHWILEQLRSGDIKAFEGQYQN